ncbi:MAG TPA: hypothetical protein P5556_05870, partial [Candidatus Gastranaerophilales bacterium]|nr:hypothetical protein [Candidatus Gastranaerophilales bacterium]
IKNKDQDDAIKANDAKDVVQDADIEELEVKQNADDAKNKDQDDAIKANDAKNVAQDAAIKANDAKDVAQQAQIDQNKVVIQESLTKINDINDQVTVIAADIKNNTANDAITTKVVSELKAQTDELAGVIDELKLQSDDNTDLIYELENSLEAAVDQIITIEETTAEHEVKLDQHDKAINVLDAGFINMQGELQALGITDAQIQNLYKTLQTQVVANDLDMAQTQAVINQLKTQLNNNDTLDAIQTTAINNDVDVDTANSLTNLVNGIIQTVTLQNTAITVNSQDIAANTQADIQRDAQIGNINTSITSINTSIAELQKVDGDHTQALATLNSELTKLNTEMDGVQLTNSDQDKAIAANAKAAQDNAQAIINNAQAIATINNSITTINNAIAELQKVDGDHTKALATLNTAMNALNGEMAKVKLSDSQQDKDIKANAEAARAAAQMSINNAGAIAQQQVQLNGLQNRVASLEKGVIDLNKALEGLTKDQRDEFLKANLNPNEYNVVKNLNLMELGASSAPKYVLAKGKSDGLMHVYQQLSGDSAYKSVTQAQSGSNYLYLQGSASTNQQAYQQAVNNNTGYVLNQRNYSTGSPLIFDMDNDGVEAQHGIGVDVDNDGKADGAAVGGDKMLAMGDLNGNGKIDGSEVFGNETINPFTGEKLNAENGFEALKLIAEAAEQKTGLDIIQGNHVLIEELQKALAQNNIALGLISDNNVSNLEGLNDIFKVDLNYED